MTNTTPPIELPNHLSLLIASLMHSIESVETPPLSGEPGFTEYLNNQALLQQVLLAHHFQSCLNFDPNDQVAAAGIQKALALIERSRSRVDRPITNHTTKLPQPQPDRDEACHFLQSELTPGPRPVSDLMPRARLLGIAPVTLRRAKARLNIISSLHVMPDKLRFWTWALPEHARLDDFNPPEPFFLRPSQDSAPSTQNSDSDTQVSELSALVSDSKTKGAQALTPFA